MLKNKNNILFNELISLVVLGFILCCHMVYVFVICTCIFNYFF